MRAHEAGALHAEGYGGPPIWLPYPMDVMELVPELWSSTVRRDQEGRLTVGGVDVVSLAADVGTAAYVLDEEDFRMRCRAYRDEFTRPFASIGGGADVFYAGKAFLCTAVARWVAEEGLNLDVCTGGELAVAQRAGFPGDRIGLHGNNKSVAEIEQALSYGVGRIVVDSFDEIDRIAAVAERLGVVAPVMIRVTVGVEAHTHEFIATGHEDQKFGFSLERPGGCGRRGRPATPRSSTCAGCTPTSARRSSTPAASRSRRVAWSSCTPRSADSTGLRCPSSTSAAASGSPTPPARPPDARATSAASWPTSSSASSAVSGRLCRGSPSSPAARSSGRAPSRSTRSGRSSRSTSATGTRAPMCLSTAG